MIKRVRRLLGLALLIAGALLAALWWSRSNLPYNEQGRYFDSATAVVYQEQNLAIYAVLAIGLFMAGGLLIWLRR